jgi:hypothetical protein
MKDFEASKTAVVDELTRAFRGTGGNVHDLEQWEATINSADSPEALHRAVRKATQLLQSRVDALGDQYNRGMQMRVPKDAADFLSPKARGVYDRLLGASGGGQTAAPASADTPVRVNTLEERDRLPSGRIYVGPDGTIRRKR